MIKKIYAITLFSLPTIVLPPTTIIACSNQNPNNQPGSGSNQPTTDFLEINQKQYEQSLKTLAQGAIDQDDLIIKVKAIQNYDPKTNLGNQILQAIKEAANQVRVDYKLVIPLISAADAANADKFAAAVADLNKRQMVEATITLTIGFKETTDLMPVLDEIFQNELQRLAQNATDQNDLINQVKALDDYDDALKLGVKILKAETQGSNQVLVEYQHFAPYLSFADSQDQTKLEAAIADLSQRQTLKNNIVLTLNSTQP